MTGKALIILSWLSVVAVAGCRSTRGPAGPSLSMPDALAIVNTNAARVDGTLRAGGNVDGYFRVDGRRRSYHLDGVLFHRAPRHLRFDLKSLGDRKILLGSNAAEFWFCNTEVDECHCGTHSSSDELAEEIPVRPLEIIEALGLGGVPPGAARSQRVLDEYQQVLFGDGRLEKEYWLDRSEPRLIRRVIFRDTDGVVRMQSSLDDYRSLGPGGPWLPHTMTADWPTTGAHLRFRISKWSLVSEVGADGPQFATPAECGALRQASTGPG